MTGRKSFIMYSDYKQHIDLLSDEEKGKLFSALFDYIETGEAPLLPPMATMAFSFMKLQLDRDWEKYMIAVETRRENGKLGGRPKKQKVVEETFEEPDKPNGYLEEPKKPNGYFEKPNITEHNLKKHDNGTDNGTDNDNGTVNGTDIGPIRTSESEPITSVSYFSFSPPTIEMVKEYCKENGLIVDPDWFVKYYTDRNWQTKTGPMKDWKAALNQWNEQDQNKQYRPKTKSMEVVKKRYEGLVE